MNKKIWEKPEMKILDVKRDTKFVATCNPSGGGSGHGHGGGSGHGHGGGSGHGHGGGSEHGHGGWPGNGGHWPF